MGQAVAKDFGQRVSDVKAALTFGDAAGALGLKGSNKAGWDCPNCASPNCLKERMDHRGARCTVCRQGYDVPGLVMRHQGDGAVAALTWCEAQIREREAVSDAPGLFEFDPGALRHGSGSRLSDEISDEAHPRGSTSLTMRAVTSPEHDPSAAPRQAPADRGSIQKEEPGDDQQN